MRVMLDEETLGEDSMSVNESDLYNEEVLNILVSLVQIIATAHR